MMIQSVGYALSWAFWRRGIYWFVPACAILVVAFIAPVFVVLPNSADVRAEVNHAVFGVVWWAALIMAAASHGLLRRQYTMPVPTAALVGWTAVNGSLAVAILYGLTACGVNLLFRAGWPLWGPAWWTVVAYTAFQAAAWLVTNRRGNIAIPVLLLTLLAVFVGAPNLYHRLVPAAGDMSQTPVWPTISAAELAASLAVVVVSYLAAVYVVGRDRRGDGWTLAWLSVWRARRVSEHVPATVATPSDFSPRSFCSPQAAQFWMEWRSRGRYVVLSVTTTVLVLWAIAAWNRFDRYVVLSAIDGLTATLALMSPFVGIYLGYRSDRFDMKPFLATRPLANGDLAMVVLRHAAVVFGVSAIIWLIGAGGLGAIWFRTHDPFWPLPTMHDAASTLCLKALRLGGVLLVVWTLVNLGASLAMARSWFVPVGGLGGSVLLIALMNIAGRALPPFSAVAAILLAGGLLGGTSAAFMAARRRKLVSVRITICALTAYVIVVLMCLLLLPHENITSLETLLMITCVCALPLAPLAAAPLALSWNRHR